MRPRRSRISGLIIHCLLEIKNQSLFLRLCVVSGLLTLPRCFLLSKNMVIHLIGYELRYSWVNSDYVYQFTVAICLMFVSAHITLLTLISCQNVWLGLSFFVTVKYWHSLKLSVKLSGFYASFYAGLGIEVYSRFRLESRFDYSCENVSTHFEMSTHIKRFIIAMGIKFPIQLGWKSFNWVTGVCKSKLANKFKIAANSVIKCH